MTSIKTLFNVRAKQLAQGWGHSINDVPKGVLLFMAVLMGWLLFRPGVVLSEMRVCIALISLGVFYLVAIYGLCLRGLSAINLEKDNHV